jgi:hypothetical protein
MQDLPHRGGSDRVADLDEFALHPPVPPRRVLRRHADHELSDRGRRGRSPGTPPARTATRALITLGRSIADLELRDEHADDGVTAPTMIPDLHLIPGCGRSTGTPSCRATCSGSSPSPQARTSSRFPMTGGGTTGRRASPQGADQPLAAGVAAGAAGRQAHPGRSFDGRAGGPVLLGVPGGLAGHSPAGHLWHPVPGVPR